MEKEVKGAKHLKTKRGKCNFDSDMSRKLLPFIPDIIVAVSIALLAVLESIYFKGCCPVLDSFEVFIVSTTLLPCIVTILSISLSVSNEKIYGAKLSEIKDLRSPFYFGFYRVALITCVAFAFNILLKLLGLGVSLFFLEVIALVYCVIFILQDVPVLARSDRKIAKLLRNYYKKIVLEKHFYLNKRHEVFTRMVTNMLLTRGLKEAFCALNSPTVDETELISDLLKIQNNYFWDIKHNISSRQLSGIENYCDNSLIRVINAGYDNVDALAFSAEPLFFENDFNEDQRNMVTASIYKLHIICKTLKLQEIEQSKMKAMLSGSWTCQKSYKEKNAAVDVILHMVLSTINEGDTWFLRLLRDDTEGLSLLFSSDNPLGYFISMIVYHFANKRFLVDEGNRIKAFLGEPEKGINSDGFSWRTAMSKSMYYVRKEQMIKWLPWFLSYYEIVKEAAQHSHGNNRRRSFDADEVFAINTVVRNWLLMVCESCKRSFFGKEDFNVFEEPLDSYQRSAVAEELSKNWVDGNSIKNNIDASFLVFYELILPDTSISNLMSSRLKEAMAEYPRHFYSTKLDEALKNRPNLDRLLSDTLTGIRDVTKSNPFFDATIGADNAKQLSICAKVFVDSQGKWLEEILGIFSKRLNHFLETEILQKVPATTIPKGELKSQTEMRVLNFNPHYVTSGNCFFGALETNCERFLKIRNRMVKIDDIGDISNICSKKKGIRLNVFIGEERPIIRKLTAEEVDQFLRSDCQNLGDGKFCYVRYLGEENERVVLTKSELEQYIQATVYCADLNYRCKVELVPEKIMRLEWER